MDQLFLPVSARLSTHEDFRSPQYAKIRSYLTISRKAASPLVAIVLHPTHKDPNQNPPPPPGQNLLMEHAVSKPQPR